MATTRVRRSAGTDVFGKLFGRAKPELDLENFRNGTAFKVAGLMRRFEDMGKPGTLRNGFLHLAQGQPVTWLGRGGAQLLIGPFELNEIGGQLPLGRHLTRCLLATSQNDYELAVPTVDLDLVRLALGINAE